MEPVPTALRQHLCQLAIESSLILDHQLNQLLDAYDFFTHRYPPTTESEHFQLADLAVSIKELGRIPHEIATMVLDIRSEKTRHVFAEGFEINVLNEFALHMHSLALFMFRKHINLDFNPKQFDQVIENLRFVNRKLSPA